MFITREQLLASIDACEFNSDFENDFSQNTVYSADKINSSIASGSDAGGIIYLSKFKRSQVQNARDKLVRTIVEIPFNKYLGINDYNYNSLKDEEISIINKIRFSLNCIK